MYNPKIKHPIKINNLQGKYFLITKKRINISKTITMFIYVKLTVTPKYKSGFSLLINSWNTDANIIKNNTCFKLLIKFNIGTLVKRIKIIINKPNKPNMIKL